MSPNEPTLTNFDESSFTCNVFARIGSTPDASDVRSTFNSCVDGPRFSITNVTSPARTDTGDATNPKSCSTTVTRTPCAAPPDPQPDSPTANNDTKTNGATYRAPLR